MESPNYAKSPNLLVVEVQAAHVRIVGYFSNLISRVLELVHVGDGVGSVKLAQLGKLVRVHLVPDFIRQSMPIIADQIPKVKMAITGGIYFTRL